MKCRFVSPDSPNDGLLVESLGAPGYDPVNDEIRFDWVSIKILEDARSGNALAGTFSACHKSKLQQVEEGV